MESITASKFLAVASMTLITLGLLGLFIKSNLIGKPIGQQVIDIQSHDTYYVFLKIQIIISITIILGFCSIIYFVYPTLFKRDMIKMLSNVHVIVSIVCAFIILYVLVFNNFKSNEPSYFLVGDTSKMRHENTFYLWIFFSYSTMILLFIQLMLITNIVLSFWFGRYT